MSKKTLAALAVAFCLVAVPAFAQDEAALFEEMSQISIDRADTALLAAWDLFHDILIGGIYSPALFNGNELLRYNGRDRTSAQWYKRGYFLYEKAWDSAVDGRNRQSVRLANRANGIFNMLLNKATKTN